MRISQVGAEGTSSRHRRELTDSLEVPPRLWPWLPLEARRQLAQQIGELVQRLLSQSARGEDGHRAEFDIVDR
jgi:hypothetical protein